MVALVEGQPKLLNLRQMLDAFVGHRREVVTRRTLFELRKARDRAHVLEGLTVALANLDEVIELIKASPTPAEAKERLLARLWEPGLVRAMLGQGGAETSRPEDLEVAVRTAGRGIPVVACPGPGNPEYASAPPDRAGAGQADQGIRRDSRAG